MKCKQCGQKRPPVFVVNRTAVLAGAALLIVPADKVGVHEHFDVVLCGKECFLSYVSGQADAILGIEDTPHMAGDKRIECPVCGSLMPFGEGKVCLDCQAAGLSERDAAHGRTA